MICREDKSGTRRKGGMLIGHLWRNSSPIATFIVPEGRGGRKLTPAKGSRTGPPGYIGWQVAEAGTTALCRSQLLYPPFRDQGCW
jgi:hypothetical protein